MPDVSSSQSYVKALAPEIGQLPRQNLRAAVKSIENLLSYIATKDDAPDPLVTGSSKPAASMKDLPRSDNLRKIQRAPDPKPLIVKKEPEEEASGNESVPSSTPSSGKASGLTSPGPSDDQESPTDDQMRSVGDDQEPIETPLPKSKAKAKERLVNQNTEKTTGATPDRQLSAKPIQPPAPKKGLQPQDLDKAKAASASSQPIIEDKPKPKSAASNEIALQSASSSTIRGKLASPVSFDDQNSLIDDELDLGDAVTIDPFKSITKPNPLLGNRNDETITTGSSRTKTLRRPETPQVTKAARSGQDRASGPKGRKTGRPKKTVKRLPLGRQAKIVSQTVQPAVRSPPATRPAAIRVLSGNSSGPEPENAAADDMSVGQDLAMVTAVGTATEAATSITTEAKPLGDLADHTRKVTGPTILVTLGVGLASSWGKGIRFLYRRWKLNRLKKTIKTLEDKRDAGSTQQLAKLQLLKKDLEEQTKVLTTGNVVETATGLSATMGTASVGIHGALAAEQSSNLGNVLKNIVLNEPLSTHATLSVAGRVGSVLSVAAGVVLAPLFAISSYNNFKQWNQLRKTQNRWKEQDSKPTQKVPNGGGDAGVVHKVGKLVEDKVTKNKRALLVASASDALVAASAVVGGIFGIAALTGGTIVGAPVVLPIAATTATVAACAYLGYRAIRHIRSKYRKWSCRRARNAIAKELKMSHANVNQGTARTRFRPSRPAVKRMIAVYNDDRPWDKLPSMDLLDSNHMKLLLRYINEKLMDRDTRTATNEIYRQIKSQPLPTELDYDQEINLGPAALLLKSAGVTLDAFKDIINSNDPVRAKNALAKCLLLV